MKRNFFFTTLCAILFSSNLIAQLEDYDSLVDQYLTSPPDNGWMWFQTPNILSAGMVFTEYQNHTGDTDNGMVFVKDWIDPQLNMHHYKYKQTYKNVPVEGTGLIEHYGSENEGLVLANSKLAVELDMDVKPNLSEAQALQSLLSSFNSETVFAWQNADWELDYQQNTGDPNATNYPKGELILALDNFRNIDHLISGNRYTLAYKFEVLVLSPSSHKEYWVDANTGQVLKSLTCVHNDGVSTIERHLAQSNLSETIDTRQRGFLNGNDWVLETDNNDVQIHTKYYTTSNWVNRPEIDDGDDIWTGTEVHATTGHWYVQRTWEYFRDIWQLDGIDDDNENVRIEIHSSFTGNNASSTRANGLRWLKFSFNNNVSMARYCDVVAHEYTHGIIEHSCELEYEGESGALNESFADIFGIMSERFILGNSAVTNWLYGGDPNFLGAGTRSFIAPNNEGTHSFNNNGVCDSDDGQPDTFLGDFWQDVNLLCDNSGVHGNSGVQNHWFYLLSDGGIGTNDNNDNFNVTGIGMDDAAEIAFWSMQNELMELSDYADARTGAVAAAILLFGNCSNQHGQTENAWYAVGVGAESACVGLYIEENEDNNFSIFPNPTRDVVNLNWNNKTSFDITVYDMSGRVIFSRNNISNSLNVNLETIPSGSYIVECKDGDEVVRKKVIKY